jgi:hypothetical protein
MRNGKWQLVMILGICLAFPTYSVTIRNPKTNMCIDCGGTDYKQVSCSAGSPSQTWIRDKSTLKCQKSGKCLARKPSGEAIVQNCTNLKEQHFLEDNRVEHQLYHADSGKCLTLGKGGEIVFKNCGNAKGDGSQDVYNN